MQIKIGSQKNRLDMGLREIDSKYESILHGKELEVYLPRAWFALHATMTATMGPELEPRQIDCNSARFRPWLHQPFAPVGDDFPWLDQCAGPLASQWPELPWHPCTQRRWLTRIASSWRLLAKRACASAWYTTTWCSHSSGWSWFEPIACFGPNPPPPSTCWVYTGN